MLQKIIAFSLCVLLILSFSLTTMAHPLLLNVTYDECSQENLVDGENELWYKLDEVFNHPFNMPFHLSHETLEIKYYFSPNNTKDPDKTWISCIKEAAEEWQINLTDEEAETIVQQIQMLYAQSMEKWNDVYYYSYNSDGELVPNKVITVKYEENPEKANLIINPDYIDGDDNSGDNSDNNDDNNNDAVASTYFYGTNYVNNVPDTQFHYHVNKYITTLYLKVFYEAVEQVTTSSAIRLNTIRENTGAHEIGHLLGLADLDVWCEKECFCNVCTDNNSDNDKNCEYKGHHEEAIMGYGQTEYRVTHITFKDIAGVSITRGFHKDSDHKWMLRNNVEDSTQDVICALCNGVRYEVQKEIQYINGVYYYENKEVVLFGSCNGEHIIDNGNMLLVATDTIRDFYKCLCCRYILEVPHSVHSYTEWTKLSSTHHIECCEYCGQIGTQTGLHTVRLSEVVLGIGHCMYCGAKVMLKDDIAQVPFNTQKVTLNGSYILPNGIIVLVDEDIEAYENGTLVFYDKDKLPQIQ